MAVKRMMRRLADGCDDVGTLGKQTECGGDMSLIEPERARLAARADELMRRRYKIIFGVLGGVAVAVWIVVAVTWHDDPGHSHHVTAAVVVAAVTMTVAVGLILFARWSISRYTGDVALVIGADPQTRAAFRRALREGSTTDRRVHALVRDQAERWPRLMWRLALPQFIVMVAMVLNAHGSLRFVNFGAAAGMLVSLGNLFVMNHRIRNYRGLRLRRSAARSRSNRSA
jgi:hypothetical protein